jgi:hypothetical protein
MDYDMSQYYLEISKALRSLGTGDSCTRMGAIELLSKEVKEGSERISEALNNIAQAIACCAK